MRYVATKLGRPQNTDICQTAEILGQVINTNRHNPTGLTEEYHNLAFVILLIAQDVTNPEIDERISSIPSLLTLVNALRQSKQGNCSHLLGLDHGDYVMEIHPMTLKYWAEIELEMGSANKSKDIVREALKRSPTFVDLYTLYNSACRKTRSEYTQHVAQVNAIIKGASHA